MYRRNAMKNTLFLAINFVSLLPTIFFSISLYNILSSRRLTLFPLPYIHLEITSEGRLPHPPYRTAILHNIRILIIHVSSVRNVADEYEIAGLQLYVIRPRAGKVPRDRRRRCGVASGWPAGGEHKCPAGRE